MHEKAHACTVKCPARNRQKKKNHFYLPEFSEMEIHGRSHKPCDERGVFAGAPDFYIVMQGTHVCSHWFETERPTGSVEAERM